MLKMLRSIIKPKVKNPNSPLNNKDNIIKWIFTRWYFWAIVILKSGLNFIQDYYENGFGGAIGGLFGNFVSILIIFFIIRIVLFSIGKIINKLKNG